MDTDRAHLVSTHAARLVAEAEEWSAIVNACGRQTLSESEIAYITGLPEEVIRQICIAAELPVDKDKSRIEAPDLIYAFRDETGVWWPRGNERLLSTGYVVGSRMRIYARLPSRFSGQILTTMYVPESDLLLDDSPGYAYMLTDGRKRRTTKAVHEVIWRAGS